MTSHLVGTESVRLASIGEVDIRLFRKKTLARGEAAPVCSSCSPFPLVLGAKPGSWNDRLQRQEPLHLGRRNPRDRESLRSVRALHRSSWIGHSPPEVSHVLDRGRADAQPPAFADFSKMDEPIGFLCGRDQLTLRTRRDQMEHFQPLAEGQLVASDEEGPRPDPMKRLRLKRPPKLL